MTYSSQWRHATHLYSAACCPLSRLQSAAAAAAAGMTSVSMLAGSCVDHATNDLLEVRNLTFLWTDGWMDRYPSAAQRARPFIPFCPLESRSFGSMFVTIYATLLVLYADLHPSLLYGSHSCLLIYPLGPFSSRYLPFLCFDSKCCMSSYDSLLVASCSVHSPTGLCQCG